MKLQQKHYLRISIASGLIAFWVFVAMIMFGCAGVSNFEHKAYYLKAEINVCPNRDCFPLYCREINAEACYLRRMGLNRIFVIARKQVGGLLEIREHYFGEALHVALREDHPELKQYHINPSDTGHEALHALDKDNKGIFADPDRIGSFGFSDE